MMQVIIESPRMVLSDKLQELINEKMNHIGKMSDRITKCVVVLRKEKNDQDKDSFIEVQLALPQKSIFASERAGTFEVALDMVVNDLGSQLRKYKTEREKNGKGITN
ncbi:MAG TPA: ribosome-associated translation inhibitor RaiA [Chitinophagaceae bacterium]